jgi:hypothetical protein
MATACTATPGVVDGYTLHISSADGGNATRPTPGTSILLVVERDTPSRSILQVVERDTHPARPSAGFARDMCLLNEVENSDVNAGLLRKITKFFRHRHFTVKVK